MHEHAHLQYMGAASRIRGIAATADTEACYINCVS